MSEQQQQPEIAEEAVPVDPIIQRVQERFGEDVLEVVERLGEITLVIRREALIPVTRHLRDDPELQFDHLSDVTAVDYLNRGREPRFDVVYHFYSIPRRHRVRLRVPVTEDEPVVDSLTPEWPTANFLERETYDMFGIRFVGHPNLERILLPDDWEGHPLRKDYPMYGEEVAFSHNQDRLQRKTLGYG